ncbi:MAG: hypothetical protein PHU14_02945 [Methylovulum sp.]|nr:hypothetical protein [Methylovulum sp.]
MTGLTVHPSTSSGRTVNPILLKLQAQILNLMAVIYAPEGTPEHEQ